MTYQVNYNERSWAIDVIGRIKTYLHHKNRTIQDAGGEQTLRTEGGSLFPDVLLFGDKNSARILQGWELKMPDTPINDPDFIENAEKKARILGLDSFLLWNVTYAHLYILEKESNCFILKKEWDDLYQIKSRRNVQNHRSLWEKLLNKIIDDLNNLFDHGDIEGKRFIEAYQSGGITSFILENSKYLELVLKEKSTTDNLFKAELLMWDIRYKSEYGKVQTPETSLARVVLSNWIGKFLFAHILSGFDNKAKIIFNIDESTSPQDALDIFKKISEVCNFWTIFSDALGLSLIPQYSWNHILQFNELLKDLHISSIDQAQLSKILETTVDVSVRKLRGQYPTPNNLAKLLIELSVKNPKDDRVLDPCSGSGTIIRAALEQKLKITSKEKISELIFASDQDHQANQITTFALIHPELIRLPIRIFNQDVFNLKPDLQVKFRNPDNGQEFVESLGSFDSIVSNLPFISKNDRKAQYDTAIAIVNEMLAVQKLTISNRADISAYIPFALYPMLKYNGILGLIISNSWLGTDWGDEFFNLLTHYYHLKTVIISGAGRWFQNSEVVTNVLILEKKEELNELLDTNFIILKQPLSDLGDIENLSLISAQIQLGTIHQADSLDIHKISLRTLKEFQKYGLRGNIQFLQSEWILDLPLLHLSDVLVINRGERGGANDFFYPNDISSIEKKHLKPVLRTARVLKSYIANTNQFIFDCRISESNLLKNNDMGAYNWIQQFKNVKNASNKLLPEVLGKQRAKNKFWYEPLTDRLSDFVFSMNLNTRLFISKFEEPSFADQRLVCMSIKDDYRKDIDVIHAILNSAITYLFIEGMFFGKGLGALDLNQTRFKKFMHILNPSLLSSQQKSNIKEKFKLLVSRDVMEIYEEIEMEDRRIFDQSILDAFKVKKPLDEIYSDLLTLVNLRQTALVKFE